MNIQENIKTARALFPGDKKRVRPDRHINTLNRRIEYLKNQLETKQCSVNSSTYLRSELSALRWAIDIVNPPETTE